MASALRLCVLQRMWSSSSRRDGLQPKVKIDRRTGVTSAKPVEVLVGVAGESLGFPFLEEMIIIIVLINHNIKKILRIIDFRLG